MTVSRESAYVRHLVFVRRSAAWWCGKARLVASGTGAVFHPPHWALHPGRAQRAQTHPLADGASMLRSVRKDTETLLNTFLGLLEELAPWRLPKAPQRSTASTL